MPTGLSSNVLLHFVGVWYWPRLCENPKSEIDHNEKHAGCPEIGPYHNAWGAQIKNEYWKGWLEGIGIVAIVASLLFVGLQMRQAQQFAMAEVYQKTLSSRSELTNSINENVVIWNKGRSGGELTDDEARHLESHFYFQCRLAGS